ncbi:MAG: BamA/TamA family outer membrane protein [Bradyrhizobiaceae bacterium]|nr:BamA/TamA family outer membrane protein [Bradyrhizobiaceae bacterium]
MQKGIGCRDSSLVWVRRVACACLWWCVAWSGSARAQESQDSADKIGLAGVPYLSYAPETKIKLGVAGALTMHLDDRQVMNRRASTLSLGLAVTQLQQFKAAAKFDLYFNRLRSKVSGVVSYERMPYRFYGLGPYSLQDNEVWFRPDYVRTELSYLHRIVQTDEGQGLSVGARFDYLNSMMQSDVLPPAPSAPPTGWNGGTGVGLGMVLTFDNRDNPYFTAKNEYAEVRTVRYLNALGSTFDYTRCFVDLRKFYGFYIGDHPTVLGGQVVWDATFGDAPFYDMPTYGGSDRMRGMLAGRYVDRSAIAAQIEMRTKLFWVVGAAVFLGVGDVAPSVGAHRFAHTKVSGGAGLRAYLDSEGGLIGRIDIGLSEWGTGLYVTFAEAF